MYLAHERQHAMPPPLSMDPPPPIERTGPSYPTPSSASATIPPNMPPLPTSAEQHGKKYSLEIVQQPIRARMCGFGDKDRRPITPPPCIRLVVLDAKSGHEVDISEIDTSFFVLTVDLWDHLGAKEVNLVRHSQTSPSISAATSASYPPPQTPIQQSPYTMPQQYQLGSTYGQSPTHIMPAQQMYQPQSSGYHTHPYQSSMYQQQQLPPLTSQQQQGYYGSHSTTPITPNSYYAPQIQQAQGPLLSPQNIAPATGIDPRTTPPNGMFTRNLIGSLGVSAFKLTNPENRLGIWFILQDLSVRTEGSFRLKMNFVNVGSPTGASLNEGSAPVLASCFSDVFQVFSAKKFPGVIESTGLSKCFATQGIKIPIRKDGPRGNIRDKDEEED